MANKKFKPWLHIESDGSVTDLRKLKQGETILNLNIHERTILRYCLASMIVDLKKKGVGNRVIQRDVTYLESLQAKLEKKCRSCGSPLGKE